MPFPVAAAIAGGSALLGGAIQAGSTGRMNRKSMKFSREMYERQYRDNLNFWNLQNEYNSPQSQMKRFQEAGLNPHLIYGQGNSGSAGSVSTPDVQSPQFRTPEWGNAVSAGGLSTINAIYDLDIKAATADNLRAQNTVIEQDALLRAAQIAATRASTSRQEFDLGFETEFRDISGEARREGLRQLKTNVDISLNRDVREAVMNSTSVAEANQRILKLVDERSNMALMRAHTEADTARIKAETARIKSNISLLQKEGVIKQLDADLATDGIRPGDPLWYRAVSQMYNSVLDFLK